MTRALLSLAVAASLVAGCGCRPQEDVVPLRIFHASGLTPLLEEVREGCRRDAGIELQTEASGSQAACRKLMELGRDCDLVMLADARLVADLLAGRCTWRIDFATDEVVLGVGARAPNAGLAEESWPDALLEPGVRIGRVDEAQGPIGYRTLLVWKLCEMAGRPGLARALTDRTGVIVDHVSRLTPLLRSGEVDYAFAYRSICIAHEVRYIELPPAVNLGSPDLDYSAAEVSYPSLAAGSDRRVTVRGDPILWTLSIPDGGDATAAREFVRYLLAQRTDALTATGLRPLSPARFYGPAREHEHFRDVAQLAGSLGQ